MTIFIPFRENFHFKEVKSDFFLVKFHSFEVKIHSKRNKNCYSFQKMKGGCIFTFLEWEIFTARNLERKENKIIAIGNPF